MRDEELKKALAVVCDVACRWGENAEEGFARRVGENDTDAACAVLAEESQVDVEDVVLVRDLWRALALILPEKGGKP